MEVVYQGPAPTNSKMVDWCLFQDKVIVICENMTVWCRKAGPDAKWLKIVPYPKK